jgi:hypothetical protein
LDSGLLGPALSLEDSDGAFLAEVSEVSEVSEVDFEAVVRRLAGAFFGSAPELASGFSALAVLSDCSDASVATLVSDESEPVARLERRTGLSCWISSMFFITHFYAANCRCLET